jgi:hypothetical protein
MSENLTDTSGQPAKKPHGRPISQKSRIVVSVNLDPDSVAIIDQLAAILGSRHAATKAAVLAGLPLVLVQHQTAADRKPA